MKFFEINLYKNCPAIVSRENLLRDKRRRYISTRNLHIPLPIWVKSCREKLDVVLLSVYDVREIGRSEKHSCLWGVN
jgi:hypothetical protein